MFYFFYSLYYCMAKYHSKCLRALQHGAYRPFCKM